jgi:uncharacterized repeat protein (TIGR03803 family)
MTWSKVHSLIALGAMFFGADQGANSAPVARARFAPAPLRAASKLTVLYKFGLSGYLPMGDLIFANGLIYGTAAGGGTKGNGIVFDMTPAGAFNVVYAFNGTPDGSGPSSGVTFVDGDIYGTTFEGGHVGDGPKGGCGTLFAIAASGSESVLSRFGCAPQLEAPEGKLLSYNGMFYGTTLEGGSARSGTIFSTTKLGKTKILHDFAGPDGGGPQAGLVEVDGTMYGTTGGGGTNNDGTVFALSSTGAETVLHSFDGADGKFPRSSLVAVNGTLYGTTYTGGAYGNGVVFSITPGEPTRSFTTSPGCLTGPTRARASPRTAAPSTGRP